MLKNEKGITLIALVVMLVVTTISNRCDCSKNK